MDLLKEIGSIEDIIQSSSIINPITNLDKRLVNIWKVNKRIRSKLAIIENPIITGFVYLAVLMGFVASMAFLLSSSTYENRSMIASTFLVLSCITIGHIGWKYELNYAVKTGISLMITIGFLYFLSNFLFSDFTYFYKMVMSDYIPKTYSSNTGTSWNLARFTLPSLQDFIFIKIIHLISFYYGNFVYIVTLLLSGSLLRSLKDRDFIGLSFNKRRLSVIKICLLLTLILMSFYIQQYYEPNTFTRPKDLSSIKLPSIEYKVGYVFEVHHNNSGFLQYILEDKYKEFGNLWFLEEELFNLSYISTNTLSMESEGILTPFRHTRELSTGSEVFPLLGSIYLPINNVQEILGSKINNSFPFKGFEPVLYDQIAFTYCWYDDEEHKLPVQTLKYESIDNNSKYFFHFDIQTGLLVNAILIKTEGENWIDTVYSPKLTITRRWPINYISNPQKYQFTDIFINLILYGLSSFFFIVTLRYYQKKRKIEGRYFIHIRN